LNNSPEIILGIDPGTIVMGYGVIEIKNKQPFLIEMGVLKLAKYKDTMLRLKIIYNKIAELHRVHHPSAFAIEAPFFGKNVQSMLKLGRAQGVAIASNLQFGIDVHEYSPKKIKQSVTGNGNASKEQVWRMMQQILHFKEAPEYLDATDALSVALCHFYQSSSVLKDLGKEKDWSAFLKNNPDRIKK
jgi:crossover junction endodeoxyribonuclease RuvC